MTRVLIVEDDDLLNETIAVAVERRGWEARSAHDLRGGLEAGVSFAPDVVCLDVRLPDGDGVAWIPKFRALPSRPEIIIMTGRGDPDGAELAIKSGVWTYLEKGASLDAILLPITRAMEFRQSRSREPAHVLLRREGIVGEEPCFLDALEKAAQASLVDFTVLISGETGTGKEMIARTIHRNGERAEAPFVVFDCAGIPEALLESALFGHERGAFTGADRKRVGLASEANGGTLFVDEIGELPLSAQKIFLRLLQERRFRPLGGAREIQCDLRVMAATNRDLAAMVAEGTFREDLYYRLNVIHIPLPPLRDRPKDIERIAVAHGVALCRKSGRDLVGMSGEYLDALRAYDWPGNVRELINAMESSLAAALDGPTLHVAHLPTQIRVALAKKGLSAKTDNLTDEPSAASAASADGPPTYKEYREQVIARAEREYLENLLCLSNGDIARACEHAGLSPSRLYALLQKHELKARKDASPPPSSKPTRRGAS